MIFQKNVFLSNEILNQDQINRQIFMICIFVICKHFLLFIFPLWVVIPDILRPASAVLEIIQNWVSRHFSLTQKSRRAFRDSSDIILDRFSGQWFFGFSCIAFRTYIKTKYKKCLRLQ
uniref:Uncharacterized protein n=1 Tax=Cacopsylla melanoneura TaxID=428564 RepID=A0A8D8SGZ9_9HEMI